MTTHEFADDVREMLTGFFGEDEAMAIEAGYPAECERLRAQASKDDGVEYPAGLSPSELEQLRQETRAAKTID